MNITTETKSHKHPQLSNAAFYIDVEDDAMAPRIKCGNGVIVGPEAEYKTGQIVVAALDGVDGAVIREYVCIGGEVQLKASNEDYASYDMRDHAGIIIGRAVSVTITYV